MSKKLLDFIDWEFDDLKLSVPVQIIQEPKDEKLILIFREDDYGDDPALTPKEEKFYEMIAKIYNIWDDAAEVSNSLSKSHAILKSVQGKKWDVSEFWPMSLNFGFLGDPIKLELTCKYKEVKEYAY